MHQPLDYTNLDDTMNEPDYQDPAVDERWCQERHAQVLAYLQTQKIAHGRVGEWPAWHMAPFVSIWAIESAARPDWVGSWVVCGDLPTDTISADQYEHPRDALRAIATRWLEVAAYMRRGEPHPTIRIGPSYPPEELMPILERRGAILLKWANDEACWGPEYD
jgi:hypothetical protein